MGRGVSVQWVFRGRNDPRNEYLLCMNRKNLTIGYILKGLEPSLQVKFSLKGNFRKSKDNSNILVKSDMQILYMAEVINVVIRI